MQVYRKKWVIHIERITREKVNGASNDSTLSCCPAVIRAAHASPRQHHAVPTAASHVILCAARCDPSLSACHAPCADMRSAGCWQLECLLYRHSACCS